jgi:cytidylate kinase
VITIDGPAGAGKSSVGKAVALKYGYGFFSTGEMYRCLGYKVLSLGIDPCDTGKVLETARNTVWSFRRGQNNVLDVLIDGRYCGDKLLGDEVGQAASKVSAHAAARAVLTLKQKELAARGGVVMEGRDAGTVICPDAAVKIYLDASAQERAKRRLKQLEAAGKKADYDELLASIKSRDERDKNRAVAPLKPAPDALVIDASDLTIERVIDKVLKYAESIII